MGLVLFLRIQPVTLLCDCRRPCRNEQQYEEQLPQGYRRAWKSESVTSGAGPSYDQLLLHHTEHPWLLMDTVVIAVAVIAVAVPAMLSVRAAEAIRVAVKKEVAFKWKRLHAHVRSSNLREPLSEVVWKVDDIMSLIEVLMSVRDLVKVIQVATALSVVYVWCALVGALVIMNVH